MKQILIELDDRCARDLERVAPAKKRARAEFVRRAIQRAVDLALDRATAEAYLDQPQPAPIGPGDLTGWDPDNALAQPEVPGSGRRERKRRKSAA